MCILGDVEAFDMAVGAAPGDHRDLALEGNEGFQDGGLGAEILPDLFRIVAVADDRLALAVVPEASGLYYGGEAHSRAFGTGAPPPPDVRLYGPCPIPPVALKLFRPPGTGAV